LKTKKAVFFETAFSIITQRSIFAKSKNTSNSQPYGCV